MEPGHHTHRRWRRALPWLWAVPLVAIYGPVLRMGPVGEDLQWAFKGWITPSHPAGWLRPFHQHFRPAGRLFFTLGAHLFGDHWWLYRLAALLAAAALSLVAYRSLSRIFGLPPAAAGLALLLWLASPFADEVLFVTNQVKQVLYAMGVLLVLDLRSRERPRPLAVAAAALLAFAAKEEAVVLLALVFLQDWILEGRPLRAALRRSLPWLGGTAAYLLLYRSLVHFEAGWFYSTPWLAAPNLATTWTAFWHLHPPVLGRYVETLATCWPQTLAAAVLTGLVLLLARRGRRREIPFGLAAAVIALAPTLPANLQVPRYTFLAYALFTAAVLAAGRELIRVSASRWVAVALLITAAAVAANDTLTARADRRDWERYAQLTARLRSETAPVLEALRGGSEVVVIRNGDAAPLERTIFGLEGVPKVFFPRPDDPYGVTSLSALLTWDLRTQGLAAPRVLEPPRGLDVRVFLHREGGFLEVPGPAPEELQPFGHGVVILQPVAASSFDPDVFP